MITKNLKTVTVLCFAVFVVVSSQGAPFVPPSVAAGSTYHLVFVTSTGRDATSSSIADYNTFVNGQAANNPALTGTNVGVQYFAIASTANVHASANVPVTTAPVYNFAGQLVALNAADLWDGTLQNPILYDENVAPLVWEIWTGTEPTGLGGVGEELGTGTPLAGDSGQNTSDWVNWAFLNPPNTIGFSFYGVSEELTAREIPEPSALAVAALGFLGIAARRRFLS